LADQAIFLKVQETPFPTCPVDLEKRKFFE